MPPIWGPYMGQIEQMAFTEGHLREAEAALKACDERVKAAEQRAEQAKAQGAQEEAERCLESGHDFTVMRQRIERLEGMLRQIADRPGSYAIRAEIEAALEGVSE